MHQQCPCLSGKTYDQCCQSIHVHQSAKNALELMRSRYSAYVLKLVDYLIDTTHEDNEQCSANRQKWKKSLLKSCQSTHFENLTIIEFIDGKDIAYVSFKVIFMQRGQKQTMIEKSKFLKINGQWLYYNAEFAHFI